MTAAHWHLALVHIPVLFVPFACALLIYALWGRQKVLQKLAALLFVGSALAAVPAFLTGEPAEAQVEELSGVSEGAIKTHEEAAEVAFYICLVAGVLGLGTLVAGRKDRLSFRLQCVLVVVGIASSLALLRAANLGGQVRHSEIRGANDVASPEANDQDDD